MPPTRQVVLISLAGLTICACSQGSVFASLTSGLLDDAAEDSNYQEHSGSSGSWSHWWSYDGISGPDYWNINKQWRLCASGRKQSPVNIRTERLVYDHLLSPIKLRWRQSKSPNRSVDNKIGPDQANQTIPIKLINSGRGIETWLELGPSGSSLIDSSRPPSSSPERRGQHNSDAAAEWLLSSGPLSYEYKLFKLELHSTASMMTTVMSNGRANSELSDQLHEDMDELEETATNSEPDNNSSGGPQAKAPEALRTSARSSEHLIDGRPFEAELQMHFYNRHLASSAREALQMADERPPASLFAVISILIKLVVVADSSSSQPDSPAGPLDFVLDNLDQLQNQGDSMNLELERKQLEALLTDRRQYVTYEGSMNRPPCAENVDWIILNRPLKVHEHKFALIYDKLTNTNQENVRPVRQLNKRLLRTTISSLRTKKSTGRDKCQKANCNLTSQTTATEANRTRSSPTGWDQLNRHTISGPHWNRAPENQEQRCSMKPNYVYQLSYSF